MPQRWTRETVMQLLRDNGADDGLAAQIFDTLAALGMNAAEIRAWLAHPVRHHMVPGRSVTVAGDEVQLYAVAIDLLEDGRPEPFVAELERYVEATPEERTIATLFGASIDGARRLTGGDPKRAEVIAAIAESMLELLGKPQHVIEVASTELSPGSYERIVDRILRGDEQAVLAALHDGTIDVHAVQREGTILFYGW